MPRSEILATSVHCAWCALSLALNETPVPWERAPAWRREALYHTIDFWESWHQYDSLDMKSFCAATQLTWINFHKRHRWQYADLTPYASLVSDQQKKLPAMLRQYLYTRSLMDGVRFTA